MPKYGVGDILKCCSNDGIGMVTEHYLIIGITKDEYRYIIMEDNVLEHEHIDYIDAESGKYVFSWHKVA